MIRGGLSWSRSKGVKEGEMEEWDLVEEFFNRIREPEEEESEGEESEVEDKE